MPIRPNKGPTYLSAQSIAYPPFDADDCAQYPTIEALVEAESQAGHGATIRAGKAWLARSTPDLVAACALPYPTPTHCTPDPLLKLQPWHVWGASFGAIQGTLYLGSGATWSGPGSKLAQGVGAWTDIHIAGSSALWGPTPANLYVYVRRNDGLANQIGLPVTLITAP